MECLLCVKNCLKFFSGFYLLIMTNIYSYSNTEREPSVQFSRSVVSNSLRPHELQHARPLCPSLTPGVYSNSCPSSQ